MDDGDCTRCHYAVMTITDDEDLMLKCRRYPPVLVVDPEVNELVIAFPDAVWRCGEYKPERVEVIKRLED